MARLTMSALIGRVRDLIDDPNDANVVFSDDRIETACDRYRCFVRYARLVPTPTNIPSISQYLDYFAPFGDWEGDALGSAGNQVVLVDGSWTTITPDTVDLKTGHWTFLPNASPNNAGQQPPVLITGYSYDLYLAASDLLEQWASKQTRDYNFSQLGVNQQRTGKYDMLIKQSQRMAARRRPRSLRLEPADSTDFDNGGWAWSY